MKCFYCAEEIQDEARLCRFCGATREGDQWQAPTLQPKRAAQRNITLLTSGWMLILSGAWMLLTCTSAVALFGAMRGGLVAVLYNGAQAAAFLAMGYALVGRKPWALTATAVASALYTLDKVQLLLDPRTRLASLEESGQLVSALGLDAGGMLDRMISLLSLSFLAGWWGLVLYVYFKRETFRPT